MKIYNTQQNTNNLYFTSRFNTNTFHTKRALAALDRAISAKKGFEDYFDTFISRISNDNKDDVLELTQFEKYFLVTNPKTNRSFKISNKNLIEDLKQFIFINNKKSS